MLSLHVRPSAISQDSSHALSYAVAIDAEPHRRRDCLDALRQAEKATTLAKTNLLNTRTINFLELLSNGRIYQVPPYQRDYSWEEEQWEDLWNDIADLRARPGERHYMGALVVESTSDREFQIIDGQQRLASLSILALAAIHMLQSLADRGIAAHANHERASALRTRFIGEKDPASLIESSKLFLNETDNAFYQDYLVQLRPPLNPRGLPRSSQLLWRCFQYFSGRLEEVEEFRSDGAALAGLLSEVVARQLLFILITVDDELNAYTVFETLNARGIELSATDLLKNYLFSRLRVRADLVALQRRWRSLIATVAQERFPEFLRYHLLCEQSRIRTQRLFKLVRERVKSPADVFALIDALEARAELFAALSDPSHGYWAERPDNKRFIVELSLFRARQGTPLLFAAWERFSPDDFTRILKLVSVVSFRYSVVGDLNTNTLEPTYHEAAKAVLDGAARFPRDVFERLRSVYVDDAKFEQDFSFLTLATTGSSRKVAKYILARLEEDRSGRATDPETDPASIEHILPENPSSAWEAMYPVASWEADVYRLGNLALLEPSLNRDVGNADYPRKVAAYARSAYALTVDVASLAPNEWTPALLDRRQQDLAARAVHRWRADFA